MVNPGDRVTNVVSLLCEALRALGDAGRPREASLVAGRAYAELRVERPAEAQRINALMHRLARQEANLEPKEAPMPTDARELDVREEIPARRHELIFETYHGLAPGESFVLVNDHDPKPLYYQFSAEHPGEFDWEYLDSGPVVWRVRIGRKAEA
mgnify:CR=1 FL=1